MSIGQNTFWVVVNIPEGLAVCESGDQRQSIRFVSEKAAQRYIETMNLDRNFFVVVAVRG